MCESFQFSIRKFDTYNTIKLMIHTASFYVSLFVFPMNPNRDNLMIYDIYSKNDYNFDSLR